MKGKRQARGGFTLTEVLMAVGILGIGLTMVSAVFPVAINESRRGDEATHAALCARSVAAMLRMRRSYIIQYAHKELTGAPKPLATPVPAPFNVYAPGEFLYDSGRSYNSYQEADRWKAGRYTTHLIIVPLEANKGPWRIGIFVCKARGAATSYNAYSSLPAMAGEYILDPGTLRAEGYMIDYIDNKGTSALADDVIYVATGNTWAGSKTAPISWITFPGAVAAYHTIVGD